MKRLLPLLSAVLLLNTTQSLAQFYTVDDACGTTLEDISATGTATGLADDGEANAALPFAFTLYDITSTDVRIGNNGGIRFNETAGNVGFSNANLPSFTFGAAILPFWDDIDNDAGDVYYETLGTAPNRRFVIQWHQRPHFNNLGAVTFQVVLYEGSNEIRFVYDDIDFGNATIDNGVSATIGLQKDGSTADLYSFNTSIAGVTCILFTPPPPPIVVDCQSISINLDATGNYIFDTPLTPQTDAEQLVQAGTNTGMMQGQTFIPLQSGLLHSVSVQLGSPYTSGDLDFALYDGNALSGPAPTIYNSGITTAVPAGLNEFLIEASVEVVAGNTYTWILTDGTFTTGVSIAKNDGNLYLDGYNTVGAGSDFVFSTEVLQRPEIDNGTTDDDGLASFGLSQTAFTCADAGTVIPVTLSATDNLGNTSTCIANVTVNDTETPVAACVPYQAAAQIPHNYSVAPGTAIGPNPGTITSVINVPDSYDAFDVNVSANISHTWSGDLSLSLEHNGTVVNLIAGQCGSDDNLIVTFDDAGSGVTCPLAGTFTSIDLLSAFNTADVSGNWTLTVSDGAFGDGGTLNFWALDIIEDIPEMVTVLVLDATGNYTVDPLNDIDAGSSDNCTPILTTSPASFTCADIGIQSITLTAADGAGNSSSCVTSVDVVDNMAPTAVCQDFILELDVAGSGTLLTSNINNGSSDNCGIASLSLDQTSFNCAELGPNPVVLTVEDNNGLTSTCGATVTVEDNQDPVITCPTDIVECSLDATGTLVSYTLPTGTDNCTFTLGQSDASGLTSGNVFPIGTTAQQWTIIDVAGNSVSCDFTVTVNPSPEADFAYTSACQGEAVFFSDESMIDASSSIASWSWIMGDGSGAITLVDPIHSYADTGMFTVELTVTSAEGCSDVFSQVVHVTPVPTASFTVTPACEGNPTAFTNTSTIDAGNLNYSWSFGDGNTSLDESPSNTYILDGTYTVTLAVTSDDGCEDVATQSVTVNNSPTALFTASTVCEGAVTVFTNLSTGDGPLTYSWDFGDLNSSADSSPTHTYAADGVYTVVLTATNVSGCVNTHTASVTVNALPNVDFTFSNICEGTQADFVNASDPGTYNWNLGDGSSSTLTNVSHVYNTFGTYDVTLTVTNASFCMSSLTQQIEVYDLPDFTLAPSDVLCYGESTGSIVAAAQGTPAAPWTLALDGGTPQSSLTFNGLIAGTYDITVYDNNGCEFTVATTVNQPSDTLGIQLNSVLDNLCNGDNSGVIDLIGTGGTGPYAYSVDGNPSVSSGLFNGLEAGDHDIQIVDANLCVFDTLITLAEPDTLVLTLTNADDLLCNGDNSGTITVAATGGVLDYEFNLDGGTYSSSEMFDGLAAGTYIVGVLDANGCTDTLHVTLSEPGILQLSLLATEDAVCFQESNGSIQVAASSGTPPYQYSIDGVSFQGGGLFEGLAAGTYTVTVVDANGCVDQLTETIFEPSQLTIETNSVPVSCFGDATGEIEIIAAGGTPGYEYSNNGGGSFAANGGVFSDLSAANYLTVVRDDNGCTASEGVIISQPASVFILAANVTDAACLDSTSGTIQLIGTGGTPTYSFSSDNTSFASNGLFGGYGAGNYTLYAQDINGCADSIEVTVGEPATAVMITGTLLANPACPNQSSGTVTVQVSGGTPGYMYSSNAGTTYQAGQILAGLNGGNHLIVVRDANGCLSSDTITLTSPPLLTISVDSLVGVDCEGDLSGEIHVTASGGTPSFNYFLNSGNLQSNGDYVNLTDGTYSVSIMDVNGCTFAQDVVIAATQMQPVADFDYSISGTAVLFTNTSEFGDSYLWEFGDDSTSTDASPIHVYATDGDYPVTLTVTNSCGSITVTTTVSTTTIGILDNESIEFGLYPNPATTELFVHASRTVNSNLNFEIISVAGQLIKSTSVAGMSADEKIHVDVNGLANGMYYLRIVGDSHQSVIRFDIIK